MRSPSLAGVMVASHFLAESSFLRRWHQVETDGCGRPVHPARHRPGKETVLLFDAPQGGTYLHYCAKAESAGDFTPKTLDVELRHGVVVEAA